MRLFETDSPEGTETPSRSQRQHLTVPAGKRILDITTSIMALILFAPVIAAIAAWIKATSKGPILFRQERVGLHEKPFLCLKFRTMVVNADRSTHQNYVKCLIASNAPMTKLDCKGDKRLIPLGWLIRATGLDELPQLLNVIRGEMSMVGPRPSIPSEYADFNPKHRRRTSVLPGLTGLWQVSGKNRTTFEEMIELDLAYAAKHSVWTDLRIMLQTPLALIGQVIDTQAAKNAVKLAEARSVAAPQDRPLVENLRQSA